MKKRVFAAALILIGVSLLVGGSIAYYTREVTVTNVVTTGNVRIALELRQLTADGGEAPSQGPLDVVPGRVQSRIARVKNTGDAPAWVRVRADVRFTLDSASDGSAALDPSLVSFAGTDTVHWTYSDGYWYYNKALQPGETTEEIFTGITFDAAMGNLYQNSRVDVDVTVEATQTAHNGASALEAAGWPET